MNTIKHLLWGVTTAGALSLCGCGGGGSDSGDSNEPETVERVSLTGVAVKGVLANAVITITSLDGSVTHGTTRTNAQGQYSLANLSLGSDPVKVTMTTDTDTRLTCDSAVGCDNSGTQVAFGDTYLFNDSAFELTSILSSPGSATDVSLMVTPITHLAAERIAQTGVTSTADIEGTNRATASLLGLENVDITRQVPLDITNVADSVEASDAAQRYGALVAAFSTLATQNAVSLNRVIDDIADDYAVDGGLIANASSDSVIDLEDIFAGAADAADKAEDEGADLGSADVEFRANEQQASHRPEDEVVIAQDTSTLPTDSLTQAQATQKAIDLLVDMNDWNTALTGQTTENTTTAYLDQAQALYDLMPVIDDQAQTFRGLRELVVTKQSTHGVVEYQDGTLLQNTDLISQLIDLVSYIQSHHDTLDTTLNDDQTFAVSAQSMIQSGSHVSLDIEEFLTRGSSNGHLPNSSEADVAITYAMNANGRITQADFTGHNLISTLSSATMTYVLGDASDIIYTLTNLSLTGSDGEHFATSTGTITLTFGSDAQRTAYLKDRDTAGSVASLTPLVSASMVLNATQTGLQGPADDSRFDQATATLAINLSSTQDSNGMVNTNMTTAIDLTTDSITDPNDSVHGTLTLVSTADHTETGSVTTGFMRDINLSLLSLSFNGNAQAESDDGDRAEFSGEATLAGSNFQDNTPRHQSMGFSGTFRVTNSAATSILFDGSAELTVKALIASNGDPLPTGDGYLMVPESASLIGALTLEEDSGANATENAVVNVSATLQMENYDALSAAITPVTIPEYGDTLAHVQVRGFQTVSTDNVNNQAVVSLTDDFLATAETGLIAYFQATGLNPTQVTRGSSIPNELTFTLGTCTTAVDPGNADCDLAISSLSSTGQANSTTESITLAESETASPDDWLDAVLSRYTVHAGVLAQYELEEGFIEVQGALNANTLADFGTSDNPVSIDLTVQTVDIELDVERIIDDAETEANRIDASLVADIDTRALNLDDGNIRLTAERLGLDDASARLRLNYGERHIDLVINSLDGLSNRDDTRLVIFDTDTRMTIAATCATQADPDDADIAACTDGIHFSGTIFVGEFQVGTLEDRDGFPVFTFDDPDNSQYKLVITPQFVVSELQ